MSRCVSCLTHFGLNKVKQVQAARYDELAFSNTAEQSSRWSCILEVCVCLWDLGEAASPAAGLSLVNKSLWSTSLTLRAHPRLAFQCSWSCFVAMHTAVAWALGCVRVGYSRRVRDELLLHSTGIRLGWLYVPAVCAHRSCAMSGWRPDMPSRNSSGTNTNGKRAHYRTASQIAVMREEGMCHRVVSAKQVYHCRYTVCAVSLRRGPS